MILKNVPDKEGANMQIRTYRKDDEQAWVKCRVLSFLNSSYRNDVKTEKETYRGDAIELVAEEDGLIVGFIDVELRSKELTKNLATGAMIWNLGVLPEYRKQGIAQKLWNLVKEQLLVSGINYVELWTQEDIPANGFYQNNGFELVPEMTYLRCVPKPMKQTIRLSTAFSKAFFVEQMTFQANLAEKEQLLPVCQEVIEVRLYQKEFDEI